MNRKPHALNIDCVYSIGERKTKKKLGRSKFEGHIILKDNKTTIRLPMRSFVQNFLTTLQGIFAGEIGSSNANNTEIATASIAAGVSITRKAGILIGNGLSTPSITRTDLVARVSSVSYGLTYGAHSFVAPYAPTSTELKARITRLLTNASSNNFSILEVGLKTKKTASTASNVGMVLRTHDGVTETFYAASDKLVSLDFTIARTGETGGAVLNLLRVFYNLFLLGSVNYSTLLPRVGSAGSYSYASATASGAFVVDGAAAKYWGVVVGKYEDDVDTGEGEEGIGSTPPSGTNPLIDTDDYGRNFGINTSLTYGANTITSVTQSGNKVYFTVSRAITNGTTAAILLNRIGLLGKGMTAAPTAVMADQVFTMVNRSASNISLAPNQTIRVEYKFEISV